VRVISQANAGVSAARNAGIAAARGEYLSFLDQDDSWAPAKVAEQVARFRASGRVGLVHTAVDYFDEESGALVGPENPDAHPEQMVGDCYDRLLLSNPLCNSSVMVRRSVIEAVGPCDPRIRGNTVQDYDLWLRVARVSAFDYVDQPLTVFRLHGGQGHRDRRAMLGEELKVLLRILPESEWQARPERRLRLVQLYDALATAHMDADDPDPARDYFRKAWLAHRSGRQWFRFAASCLPFGPVQYVRRMRERRRGTTLKLVPRV
jgi:glycosyltransferase involved in cell wall biosynthesis